MTEVCLERDEKELKEFVSLMFPDRDIPLGRDDTS